MATYTKLTQKFSQTNPTSRIYIHTCHYTGMLFCSPRRRCWYSTEGLAMKRAEESARKNVCRVYFYLCPVTKEWHSTRTPGGRSSRAGKAIVRERNINRSRKNRMKPEAKERDRQRQRTPERIAYMRKCQRDHYKAKASTTTTK